MPAKTAVDTELRDCLAKTRGIFQQPCPGCEKSKMETPINTYQTDGDFVLEAFLPGVKAKEINTSITSKTITISGEHKEKPNISEDNYFCRERRYGAFERKLTIPIAVQSDKATVSFKDGILTLTLPKARENLRRSPKRRAK
jgi:HSP20 family protein